MKQRHWHVLGYDLTLTPKELGIGGLVCLLLLIVLWWRIRKLLKRWKASPAVKAAAVVALAATGVSLNTSWRFFGDHFGLADKAERAGIFAVLEGAQITFALLARDNQRQSAAATGKAKTGAPGLLVWAVSLIALYPAVVEAGAVAGIARWLLGPMLAAVLWHFAMGLELKTERIELKEDGLVAVLWAQAKTQLLARFGAAAPDKTALDIRQDNAMRYAVMYADRYASLSDEQRSTRKGRRTQRKLRDAVRVSEIGTNPRRLKEFVTLLSTIRNVDGLATMELRAPWENLDLLGAGEQARAKGRPRPDQNAAVPGREAANGTTSERADAANGTNRTALLDVTEREKERRGTADALNGIDLLDATEREKERGEAFGTNGTTPDFDTDAVGIALGLAIGTGEGIIDPAVFANDDFAEPTDLAEALAMIPDPSNPARGDKKTAFNHLADRRVQRGDLRVWGENEERNAFAYAVTALLPESLRATDSAARRYAEDYAKTHQRPTRFVPHQSGTRETVAAVGSE